MLGWNSLLGWNTLDLDTNLVVIAVADKFIHINLFDSSPTRGWNRGVGLDAVQVAGVLARPSAGELRR